MPRSLCKKKVSKSIKAIFNDFLISGLKTVWRNEKPLSSYFIFGIVGKKNHNELHLSKLVYQMGDNIFSHVDITREYKLVS